MSRRKSLKFTTLNAWIPKVAGDMIEGSFNAYVEELIVEDCEKRFGKKTVQKWQKEQWEAARQE